MKTTYAATKSGVSAGPESAQALAEVKLMADTSMETVQEMQEFFADPANKVKIQFPSPQTRYAWQNMSRFYPTAQILREGPISELPEKLDPSLGKITLEKGGKTETVNAHLDNYPVDAFLVVRGGRIVFERYNTMRPIDKHTRDQNNTGRSEKSRRSKRCR